MGRKNQNKNFKMNCCDRMSEERYSMKPIDLFVNCNLTIKPKNVLHYAPGEEDRKEPVTKPRKIAERGKNSKSDSEQRSEVKSVSRWVGKLYLRRLAARLRRVEKGIPERDYKTGSPLITLLISTAMKDGRINPARKVIYKTHERLQKALGKEDVLFLWELAFRKISPGIQPFKSYGNRRNSSGSSRNIDYGTENSRNGLAKRKKNKKAYPNEQAALMPVKKSLRIAAKWLSEVGREKGRFISADDKLSAEILALTTTKHWRPRTPRKLKAYYRSFSWSISYWLDRAKKTRKRSFVREETNTHYSPNTPKLKNNQELKFRSKYTF